MRLYSYVGPPEIALRARARPIGRVISAPTDVAEWIAEHRPPVDGEGFMVATFVVDAEGHLRLASRHDEHVACASGGDVRAAGELGFVTRARVGRATNQSTGYCPESSCWGEVAAALDAAGIAHPARFEPELEFRRCEACGQLAVLKADWPDCAACGAPLPQAWNLG
jgi:hypothetical protein